MKFCVDSINKSGRTFTQICLYCRYTTKSNITVDRSGFRFFFFLSFYFSFRPEALLFCICSFVDVFIQCRPVHGQYLQSSISSLRVIACLLCSGAHPTLQKCTCMLVQYYHRAAHTAVLSKGKFLLWGTKVRNVSINFIHLPVWPIEHADLAVMP